MRDISYVLRQVDAGKSIKFFRDFYGKQKVQVRTAWIWRVDVSLSDHEIQLVRQALYARRRARLAAVPLQQAV